MNSDHDSGQAERASGIPPHTERTAAVASIASGGVAGAVIGFFANAGPMGGLVGGLVGLLAGVGLGAYLRKSSKRQSARDAVLDREIGVIGGDLGSVPPPEPTPMAAGFGLRSAPAGGPIPR